MDPNALVNYELDCGSEILKLLETAGLPIAVAFWAKFPEWSDWHLYIASPWMSGDRREEARRLLRDLESRVPELNVDSFDIRLIRPDDWRATGMLAAITPVAGRMPYRGIKRFSGDSFGGSKAEAAYIYPLSNGQPDLDPNPLAESVMGRGRELLAELENAGVPITVALWAKELERSEWHLYVASPWANARDREVNDRLREIERDLPDLESVISDMRLVGSRDSIALGAVAAMQPVDPSRPYRRLRRFKGNSLNGVQIDGAYIYPLPSVMAETVSGGAG